MLLQGADLCLQEVGIAEHGVVDPVVRQHGVELGFGTVGADEILQAAVNVPDGGIGEGQPLRVEEPFRRNVGLAVLQDHGAVEFGKRLLFVAVAEFVHRVPEARIGGGISAAGDAAAGKRALDAREHQLVEVDRNGGGGAVLFQRQQGLAL